MIYFVSDLHAFHKNILKYDDLPFKDISSYKNYIIEKWNLIITDEDEVYLLGDTVVGGTNQQINEFLNSLTGKKYLVKGNHEKQIMKCDYLRKHFEWIKDYHVLDYKKQRFVLMHYPIEEWLNKKDSSIHLHGHSHGSSRYVKNRMDVGFKACNLNIYSIDEIIEKIKEHG